MIATETCQVGSPVRVYIGGDDTVFGGIVTYFYNENIIDAVVWNYHRQEWKEFKKICRKDITYSGDVSWELVGA